MVLAMASAIFSLVFLLFFLPFLAIAQTNGNISVSASLTTADEASPWLSPSGDFAFGFHQLDNKDLFLLSIWFDKIPDKTIVWYANGDNPAPRGSKIQLTADRGLVLSDPQGKVIWTSDISAGTVAYGVMNDTGNFVLASRNADNLWESFNNPTDTLLPTQIMETGQMLFARLTETNFSQGRFQLRFLSEGNLVLNPVNLPSKLAYENYYSSQTSNSSNSTNSGYRVIFNESGYMYILRRNGQRSDLTKGDTVQATKFYLRATLNFDGVFTQYVYPRTSTGNGSWSPVWFLPDNICLAIVGDVGSGACGFNSICSLNENRRPICECPQGYSLIDPNDEYGSCKPDTDLSCEDAGQNSTKDLFDFVVVRNTDWPFADYEHFQPSTEDSCRESCLHDCLCAVAIFRGDNCWKKSLPLARGRADSSYDGKAFLKFRKGNLPPSVFPLPKPENPDTKKKQDTLIITGSVLLGSSLLVNCIFVAAFCLGFSFIYQKKLIKTRQGESGFETKLRCFTYKELAAATNGFKEELGRGAFGVVYKGVIDMGSAITVAVKKLDRVARDGEKEFKNEANVIGQTHHKNLVRLLGFCDEEQNRLLVYEFLSNGTLANFLFGNSKPSWSRRTQIALDIARGLLYLHEECSTQIIHCDIKPQNILLDDYYNARISDFGLAKLLMMNQSQTCTVIRGTKGYVAPDWFRSTPVTVKVDVYSFGVLLLEITCCRRGVDTEMGGEEKAILTDWAYDCYREGKLDLLIEGDMGAMDDIRRLEKFVMIALWCIQEDISVRPTMRKVTQMLEGVVEVTVPPNPSPFSYTG